MNRINFPVFLFCFLLLRVVPVFGQTFDEELIEGLVEALPEDEEQTGYSVWVEELQSYRQNPLNINTADREQLNLLRVLSDYQINQLLNYREKYGRLYSIYEFQVIDGIDRALAESIKPFIRFGASAEARFRPRNAIKYGKHNVFMRMGGTLETPRGYIDSAGYPGNRLKYYTRYQYDYNRRVRWGLVAEKDPGEQFFRGAQKQGFDYYTAHLQIRDIGPVENLVAGDFQGQFGQGLVLSSGFRNGKSPYVLNTSKQVDGLRKYSSTNENEFFRGGGLEVSWKQFELTAFASRKKRDANLERDSTRTVITSLNATGIHATENQVEKKDVLQESVIGGQLKWQGKRLNIGASFLASRFGKPVQKETSGLQSYGFSGSTSLNAGLNYRATVKHMQFYGETALDGHGGWATVNGLVLPVSGELAASIVYRNYQPDYITLYGGAFGEQSGVQNEEGLYMGIEFYPFPGLKVAGYADHYQFPWLSYRKSAPAHGSEYFLKMAYAFNEAFNASLRFKSEKEQEDLTSDAQEYGLKQLAEVQRGYLRYNQTYNVSEQIELENRFQWAFYQKAGRRENGFMLYQDLRYRFPEFPLQLDTRIALYRTDSYQARVYAYEHDVLYAFSVPAYYGRGMRTYLLLKYEALENLHFWLKIGQTYFANRQEIGTGMNTIEGARKTNLRFQLRYQF